jgi:hypothetical protein
MDAHSQQAVFVKVACLAVACLALTGCSLGGAPSYSLFGAFFPAWLLCAAIGLTGSLALRSLVIALGIEDAVPLRLLVYTAFAASVTVMCIADASGRPLPPSAIEPVERIDIASSLPSLQAPVPTTSSIPNLSSLGDVSTRTNDTTVLARVSVPLFDGGVRDARV